MIIKLNGENLESPLLRVKIQLFLLSVRVTLLKKIKSLLFLRCCFILKPNVGNDIFAKSTNYATSTIIKKDETNRCDSFTFTAKIEARIIRPNIKLPVLSTAVIERSNNKPNREGE